jgi:hypothetical protein
MKVKAYSDSYMVAALFCLSSIASNAWSAGAPTTFHVSKDFRSLIVQGERPEIVTCMMATRFLVKHSSEFEDLRWLNTTSQTAVLNEKEINGLLFRTIMLQAQVLPDVSAIFETWKPAQVQCKQVDEGYPGVKITILDGSE